MCERSCPKCHSTEHIEMYGLAGTTLTCDNCGLLLAVRHDSENIPTDLPESEEEEYIRSRCGVRPGADAKDPADDVYYAGTAKWPPIETNEEDKASKE